MVAVSRLNRLRTAACGVVEIVGLVRRREELLEVNSREGGVIVVCVSEGIEDTGMSPEQF